MDSYGRIYRQELVQRPLEQQSYIFDHDNLHQHQHQQPEDNLNHNSTQFNHIHQAHHQQSLIQQPDDCREIAHDNQQNQYSDAFYNENYANYHSSSHCVSCENISNYHNTIQFSSQKNENNLIRQTVDCLDYQYLHQDSIQAENHKNQSILQDNPLFYHEIDGYDPSYKLLTSLNNNATSQPVIVDHNNTFQHQFNSAPNWNQEHSQSITSFNYQSNYATNSESIGISTNKQSNEIKNIKTKLQLEKQSDQQSSSPVSDSKSSKTKTTTSAKTTSTTTTSSITDNKNFEAICNELPSQPLLIVAPEKVIQRVKANKKERRRTQSINHAFSELRRHIPDVPSDTKLSKIKTLRLAINYIGHLMKFLANDKDTRQIRALTITTSIQEQEPIMTKMKTSQLRNDATNALVIINPSLPLKMDVKSKMLQFQANTLNEDQSKASAKDDKQVTGCKSTRDVRSMSNNNNNNINQNCNRDRKHRTGWPEIVWKIPTSNRNDTNTNCINNNNNNVKVEKQFIQ